MPLELAVALLLEDRAGAGEEGLGLVRAPAGQHGLGEERRAPQGVHEALAPDGIDVPRRVADQRPALARPRLSPRLAADQGGEGMGVVAEHLGARGPLRLSPGEEPRVPPPPAGRARSPADPERGDILAREQVRVAFGPLEAHTHLGHRAASDIVAHRHA